jgi:LmbE family N-acetylglucosaminyl deacetylase
MRRKESRAAARKLGATWHSPIARDLEIFYNDDLLRRVAAVVRKVRPTLVLTHSPQDYMEDHMNTSRLAVSGAFATSAATGTPPRGKARTRGLSSRKDCKVRASACPAS